MNYVFWGGRDGYQNLWNTNMKRELDHLGRFFHMAVDYAKEIGFTGKFLIEPKPKEPTTHQYDFDAAVSKPRILVARSTPTTSTPVAIGSSVPAWPTLRVEKIRRQRDTTS